MELISSVSTNIWYGISGMFWNKDQLIKAKVSNSVFYDCIVNLQLKVSPVVSAAKLRQEFYNAKL